MSFGVINSNADVVSDGDKDEDYNDPTAFNSIVKYGRQEGINYVTKCLLLTTIWFDRCKIFFNHLCGI